MCTVPYRTHMARGEARESAILSAVIGLLGELGYEAMTMDAVAARAHASKTTIYKRWPGKPQLVRAAQHLVGLAVCTPVLGRRCARRTRTYRHRAGVVQHAS